MKISNLRKSFDNFSLNIDRMETAQNRIYGVVGSNGCGKTTAMKLMAGLMKPDGGSINYDGLGPRDITMIFRKPYLLHDSVIRNLIYPLLVRGIKPDEQLLEHYLEISGLGEYRRQYAPGLSGGQQQKLSLVRAMIFSPKLIFADEAFSNMDIESVAFFENYILDRQKHNPATWVIVSHQLSNIRRLCDYVYFMYNGRVEAEGSTEDMLYRPGSDNLKRYLQFEGIETG
ncbi:MAG: ABC transporter ATP-binding protein [Defluviitaleaceae bacterium]|nr:ABC transporter ATP-binding protein [Defluviitaleaceae bacterium]